MSINLGVFFGGASVEHEVSVISALQAIHSIDREKYNVVPIYISKQGIMYTGDMLLQIDKYTDMDKLLASSEQVTLARNLQEVYLYKSPPKLMSKNIICKIDIAFPIVHGTNCEDGTIQGYFELLRLPYVGSDILASSVGMDKVIMKHVFRGNDLPVVNFLSFSSKEWQRESEEIILKIENEIGYPVIVKPANLGSSVGIKKANNAQELEEAVELAAAFALRILVEKAVVKLKEINCAVLGDYDSAKPSFCEEPIANDEILSYSDKYMSKGSSKGMSSTKRKLPAELSPEMEEEIKELAVKAFKAIGCSGVVRVDFLVDMDDNSVYVNEVNTIPGSLSFYLWEAAGVSFTQLLDEMIGLGLKRNREREKLMFTYSTNILSMQGKNGAVGSKGTKG